MLIEIISFFLLLVATSIIRTIIVKIKKHRSKKNVDKGN